MSVNDDNIFISKVIYPFTKTIILIENNRKQEWGTTQGLPIQNKTSWKLRTYFHSCTWSLPKSWPWNKTALKESPWKFRADALMCFDTDSKGSPRVFVLFSLTWLPSFCQNTAGGGFPFVPQRKVTVRPWAEIWSRGRTTIWGGTAKEKNLWTTATRPELLNFSLNLHGLALFSLNLSLNM